MTEQALKEFSALDIDPLIADRPAEPRDSSRLLVVDKAASSLSHRRFRDLADLLGPGDLLVLNRSKVWKARLAAHKATGGRSEILLMAPAAPGGLVRLNRNMAFVALTIEGLGVLALLSRFSAGENPGRGVWMAVFHAVSSFNNAVFDLFGGFTSLTGWRTDAVMVTVTAVLLISGGLSYVVLADVWRHKRFARLSLDSKLVLVVSCALLLSGTVVYLIAEGGNPATLGMVTLPHRMLDAVFQSATRTAGFTTVNVNSLNDHTLLFTIILMFIGGAAGSTAGGIKVNTFGILVATVISTLRGRSQAIAFGREFSVQQVRRALTVAVLALTFVVVVSLTLAVTEDADILTVMFEATSAFGTVGLSMGLTPHLSVTGRLVVITAMFVGRLGPLSVALALMQRQRRREYGYPGEPVRIG